MGWWMDGWMVGWQTYIVFHPKPLELQNRPTTTMHPRAGQQNETNTNFDAEYAPNSIVLGRTLREGAFASERGRGLPLFW